MRFPKKGFVRSGLQFSTPLGTKRISAWPSKPFFSPSPSAVGSLGSLLERDLEGLQSGYFLKLSLVGVGFRQWILKSTLLLDLGYSTFVAYTLPPGLGGLVARNSLLLYGVDYPLLRTVGDQLSRLRHRDSYGGKGLRLAAKPQILKKKKKDGK